MVTPTIKAFELLFCGFLVLVLLSGILLAHHFFVWNDNLREFAFDGVLFNSLCMLPTCHFL